MPQYLQAAIEIIHQGMQEEQDPRHVQTLATCLRALTAIQADYMQGGGAAAGAGAGAGAGGGGDRQANMLALLGGGGGTP